MSLFPSDGAEKVRYSMAVVSRFFAKNPSLKPTLETPIALPERNEDGIIYLKDEMLYIWTAFVLYIQRMPNLSFDIRFIKCDKYNFSDSEWGGSWFFGMFPGFLATSLYETKFKDFLTDDMFYISKYAPFYLGISGELSLQHQKEIYEKNKSERRYFGANSKDIVAKSKMSNLTISDLLSGINYQDEDCETALMVAAKANHKRNVVFLLEHGANPYFVSKNGKKASSLVKESSPALYIILKGYELLYAVKNNEYELVNRMLKSGSSSVNFQDHDGNSILHIAVNHSTLKMVRLCLSCGADPFLKNKLGQSSFDLELTEETQKLLKESQAAKKNQILELLSVANFYQTASLDNTPNNNLSFLYYIRAANLGALEALAPLERLCEEMNSDRQLELAMVFKNIFCDYQKSILWQSKAEETKEVDIKDGLKFQLK